MKKLFLIMLAVGLLVGGAQGVALAQSRDASSVPQGSQGMGGPIPSYPPDAYRAMDTSQPGWIHTDSKEALMAQGKIREIDFAHKTLTLENGERFTLPNVPEYTTLPTIGQEVEVTFVEQNGQKVVRWIDLDDTAHSRDAS